MSDTPNALIPRPRIRAAAIAWGLITAATAGTTLYVIGDPVRRVAVSNWFWTLTPGTVTLVVALTVGALLLLVGVLAAIRRAQGGRRQ